MHELKLDKQLQYTILTPGLASTLWALFRDYGRTCTRRVVRL